VLEKRVTVGNDRTVVYAIKSEVFMYFQVFQVVHSCKIQNK
jgi:hypothetical protein